MRWAHFDVEYPRPIRWIVALYGKEVIPFLLADVVADRISFGHRQISPRPIVIPSPEDYVSLLAKHHVMVDIEERKKRILAGIETIEKADNLSVLALQKLLPVVLHLVEWPFVLKANFDPAFLKAPQEVLISEMVEHQKYFPLKGKEGLVAHFIIVANNEASDMIRHGNERALAPRLTDGLFLYEQDLKTPLEQFNEKLKTLTFHKELGSIFAKVVRLQAFVSLLHHYLPLCPLEKVKRAALLSKADLVTELVKEFPELQGIIGHHYALKGGEEKDIAAAIEEHWMPRGENAQLPQTPCGLLLSLAEKIDNLISFFSIGLVPTSSSDPYALRRQAMGMIKMVIENTLFFPLQEVLAKAFDEFLKNPELDCQTKKQIIEKRTHILAEINEFFKNRLKTVFGDAGFKKDEIESVLTQELKNIMVCQSRIATLHDFREQEHKKFLHILTLYTRCRKILQTQDPVNSAVNPALLKEEVERELFLKLGTVSSDNFREAFYSLAELEPLLTKLFDTVTIVHEDAQLKKNRLSLLQMVKEQCEELIDFSKIQEHSIAY